MLKVQRRPVCRFARPLTFPKFATLTTPFTAGKEVVQKESDTLLLNTSGYYILKGLYWPRNKRQRMLRHLLTHGFWWRSQDTTLLSGKQGHSMPSESDSF